MTAGCGRVVPIPKFGKIRAGFSSKRWLTDSCSPGTAVAHCTVTVRINNLWEISASHSTVRAVATREVHPRAFSLPSEIRLCAVTTLVSMDTPRFECGSNDFSMASRCDHLSTERTLLPPAFHALVCSSTCSGALHNADPTRPTESVPPNKPRCPDSQATY